MGRIIPNEPLAARISRRARITDAGCWEWTGTRTPRGYGRVHVRGRQVYAHRLSYELAKGAIPAGMQVDHLCRNRACVNPAHLEAVSQAENLRRGEGSFDGRTQCKKGLHDITEPANVVLRGGHRRCRACAAANDQRTIARRRARREATA